MKNLVLALSVLFALACEDERETFDGFDPIPDARPGAGMNPDGSQLSFTTLASFDPALGELPEGLVLHAGVPLVGFAPTGKIVSVDGDTVTDWGQIPAPSMTYTVGMSEDVDGNVYVAVAAVGATPVPAPGVYVFGPSGGTPTLFTSSATPPMTFPNGVDVKDTDVFITDSNGVVFKAPIDTMVADAWSSDALLAGDQTACGGNGLGFDLGANGITHDADNIYVANTDFGRILRIPIRSNGMADMAEVIVESCDLHGADGIVLDTDGSILLAQNGDDKITRVWTDGTYQVLHEGLDGPASVALKTDPDKQLLVTVSAFASAASGGDPMPALVALPIP